MSLKSSFGQDGHEITPEKAAEMTARYRKQMPQMMQAGYSNALPQAETFDKAIFEKLAAQPGCTGIRAYLGLDDENLVRIIFVGVNDKNEDMLPESGGGAVYEYGQRCPPLCGVTSMLSQ